MQWDGLRYTENTLADIMKKKEMMHSMEQQEKRFFAQKLEPRNPYTPPEYGLLEQTVNVGDKTRRFFVYIPKDVRPSTSGVFVLGGNGTTAEQLMESSGWKEMADGDSSREKLIVFFLEPENGIWNVQEVYGNPSGDVAYVSAVYMRATERFHYCVHEAKNYIYGEYEGAVIAHMAAAYNPAAYAGLVTFGTQDINSDYFERCRTAGCIDLMGYQDPDNRQNRRKGNIPLPVWMIEDEERGRTANDLKRYWCAANGTRPSPQILPDNTQVYVRSAETEYPENQDREAYCVWRTNDPQYADRKPVERVRAVWERFLSRHRRWMADPGGDLRMALELERDLGMEYHYEEIDGWMREWYVYVPESVRKNPATPVPLVFALHGYSCTAEIYAGNTDWYRVARDRGFIVIHPSALPCRLNAKNMAVDPNNIPLPGWNYLHDLKDGPDEYNFFRTLLEKTCADHAVDRTRVYVTGHSHGSMMTQSLALGMPEMFAAATPCSGVILAFHYDEFVSLPELWEKQTPIPVWMFAGEQETWLLSTQPESDNATGKTLAIWHKRNRLPGTAEEHFSDKRSCYRNRWYDLTYQDAQGRPILKFTTVDYMPHATMPEMSYRIWDEFFSHWSRENGELRYR